MSDVSIPLAYHGQALELPDWLAWELSEEEPAAFRMLIIHRYVANLFSPRWGNISWRHEDHANANQNLKLK